MIVFVNLIKSPGIDSQPGGQVRQPYIFDKPARQVTSAMAESILGPLKRLQIRTQIEKKKRCSVFSKTAQCAPGLAKYTNFTIGDIAGRPGRL
jgi:hypothetical protein